jgi:anti-anti-sigma factor
VVVDLSGVDYINGAGLRVFEKTAALLSQSHVDLFVCGLQPPVRAAFDLAGAIPNLVVAASRDAALLQCQRRPRDE